MNKIRFQLNADANFVYHMLAVAGCGYDNAYDCFLIGTL